MSTPLSPAISQLQLVNDPSTISSSSFPSSHLSVFSSSRPIPVGAGAEVVTQSQSQSVSSKPSSISPVLNPLDPPKLSQPTPHTPHTPHTQQLKPNRADVRGGHGQSNVSKQLEQGEETGVAHGPGLPGLSGLSGLSGLTDSWSGSLKAKDYPSIALPTNPNNPNNPSTSQLSDADKNEREIIKENEKNCNKKNGKKSGGGVKLSLKERNKKSAAEYRKRRKEQLNGLETEVGGP